MSFTVLAKSGLNLRKSPGASGEKIALLPFGTVVDVIDTQLTTRFVFLTEHNTDVIEGKVGRWIKVAHQKSEGYVFSGFGLLSVEEEGWVVKASNINNAFRILELGPYCGPINYDPKLHWYGIVKDNGKMRLKKTEVNLRLIHEFTEKDTLDDEGFWVEYPLIVESNLTDTVLYLIGSKRPLDENGFVSERIRDREDKYVQEKFLYPEETIELYYNKRYWFHAYEEVKFTKSNPKGYEKMYQIEMSIDHLDNSDSNITYNLSKELELHDTGQKHSGYRNPLLVWAGDLNQDGILDFIYRSSTMTDACGGCISLYLFLSDKSNPKRPIQAVARTTMCSCAP